ncbi:MAG: peptidoglycan DD-metalloendopeptidase family protein [Propionibacteriaceae bacterium]|nr:peptidoglycan DD-metalloendopeptidase family protein [Propionibacteriaceae bacterium]
MVRKVSLRRMAVITCLLALVTGMFAPTTYADDLSAKKSKITKEISASKGNIAESQAALEAAGAQVEEARARVAQAQIELDAAQAEYDKAEEESQKKAEELRQATIVLTKARAEEDKGQERVDDQRESVANYARSMYQDSLPLISVATLMGAESTSDLANRVQWADTVLSTNQIDLDYLREIQEELVEARLNSQAAQEVANDAKEEADKHTAVMESARDKAEQAHLEVQQALEAEEEARRVAQSALESDQAALASQEAELKKVNAEIAEMARQAEEARKAAAKKSGSSSSGSSGANMAVSSKGLIWPTSGVVTSNYGYRIHPIYNTRQFHDGLDIGAGCGVPIKAVASGRVSQRYYSSGYGYRIFVDHGYVQGRHMVTSYNHMSGYAVANGAKVSQGQTIGYIGTTGTSTGCHLHFMLWVNGSLANPRTYLP